MSPRHPRRADALRGSIDLLILKALSLEPMHGWGIGARIQQLSKGRLDVNQGSLYPALQRLEHRGDIESDWQLSENNRRARYTRSPSRDGVRSATRWTSGSASPRRSSWCWTVKMSRLKGLSAQLRDVFRRGEAEARMEEEFQFHIEMETRKLLGEGLSPNEARRRARVTFGGLDAHSESMRDERGARWFHDIGADVRYAFHGMRRSPGFAIAVALTLGIGIGVNGAIFGYVNSILLRPLPAHDTDALVGLFLRHTRSRNVLSVAYHDHVDFRRRRCPHVGRRSSSL